MSQTSPYRLAFTVAAMHAANGLPPHLRARLDVGLGRLLDNPLHRATAAVRPGEEGRRAHVCEGLSVDYLTGLGQVVIVAVTATRHSLVDA